MKKIIVMFFLLTFWVNSFSQSHQDSLCSQVKRSIDDFTKKITINSPYRNLDDEILDMTIYKYISNKNLKYVLNLSSYGSTLKLNCSGVQILFTDGTKLIKKTKVTFDAQSSTTLYKYDAYVPLTKEELLILSKKTIDKYRLYIYDTDVDTEDANDFKCYIKCILTEE